MGFFTFNKKKQEQSDSVGSFGQPVDLPPPPSLEDPESLSDLPSFPEFAQQSSDTSVMAPPMPPPMPESMGPEPAMLEVEAPPLPPPPPEEEVPKPVFRPAPKPHPSQPPLVPKGIVQDGLYLPRDQYVELLEHVTATQTSLKSVITTLNQYKKIHAQKHAMYDSFRDAVEDLQRSLLQIDRTLFET